MGWPNITMEPGDLKVSAENGGRLSLKVSASEKGIRESLGRIRVHLQDVGVDTDEINTAELVLAEAMNNVVEHALVSEKNAEFVVDISCGRGTLACRIIDGGCAMPGLDIPKGQKFVEGTMFEDLPEGGFGWMLIRELARRLSYSRLEGKNLLEIDLSLEGGRET